MTIYRNLIFALIATLVLKVATVIPALVLADIIDNLSSARHPPVALLFAFIGLVALQALLIPLQAWCLAGLCQDRVKQLSIGWCRKLLEKRFEAFGQLHGGILVKVLDRGITAHEKWLNFLIGTAWPVLAEALVLSGLFLYLGAAPVLIGLGGLSVVYLLINNTLVRWRRPQIENVNAREDQLAEQWVDSFASACVVKLERAETAAMRPVNESLAHYAEAATAVAASAGVLQALKTIFIGLGSSGVLAWGIWDQSRTIPSLSLGELVALFTLVSGLLGGVTHLAEGWRQLDQFKVDKRRLEEWLQLPAFGPRLPDEPAIKQARPGDGLVLNTCRFQEGGELRLEIEQPLVIRRGESVALTGPSGAGKTSLLHALAGTLQATRQHLYLDGRPVDELDANEQFQHLRLCPQSPRFLPGKIARAVLFEQAHQQQSIERWMIELGLESSWYERELDGRGETVSGGEAKRLTLLRLMNRPGDFNLFDEPTSALDKALAQRTWDLLFEVFKGRGLICVTHDVEALARFDRIIHVEDGRLHAFSQLRPIAGKPSSTSEHL